MKNKKIRKKGDTERKVIIVMTKNMIIMNKILSPLQFFFFLPLSLSTFRVSKTCPFFRSFSVIFPVIVRIAIK